MAKRNNPFAWMFQSEEEDDTDTPSYSTKSETDPATAFGWMFKDPEDRALDDLFEENGEEPPEEGTKEDKRGLLKKLYDTAHIADSGKSWGRAEADEEGKKRSSLEQIKRVGTGVFSATEKVGDSVQALTGHYDRQLKKWDQQLRNGEITRDEYNHLLQEQSEDIAWAGDEDKGVADRLKKGAGVAVGAISEWYPAGKGVKAGALMGAAGGLGEELASDEEFDPKNVGLGAVLGGLFGGVGGRAGKTIDDAVSTPRGPEIIPESRQLGTGASTLQTRLDEIDQELAEFRGSEFVPTEKNIDTAGTKTSLLGDTKFAANRESGQVRVKSGTTASMEEGAFESQADRARALMRERKEVQAQLDAANTPSTLSDTLASLETPDTPTAKPDVAPAEPFTPPSAKRHKNSAFRGLVLSSKGRISRIGGQAGKEIADGLDTTYSNSRFAQANIWNQLPTIQSIKGKEFKQFAEALEALGKGETPTLTPKLQKAVDEWRAIAPTVRDSALKAGLDVGDLGEFFFPKNYFNTLKNKGEYEKAVKHLVSTKQATDEVEARNLLDAVMDNEHSVFGAFDATHSGKTYGHLEKSRVLDLPTYDKEKDVLINYIQAASDRISHAETFGASGEKALELLKKIGQSKGQKAQAEAARAFAISSGEQMASWTRPSSVLKTYEGVKSFNRLRSLDLAAILNAGQTTNTATVAGIWRTAKGVLKTLTKQEKEYIDRTGVILDSFLNQAREQTGASGKITGKLTAPFFNNIERFNRTVAAHTGKMYAEDLAKKAARGNKKALQILKDELKIEGDIGRNLTPEQELKAGQAFSDLTQFTIAPKDLPGIASSPEGKMIFQFRTFAYKQTGFMYNQVLKEAASGNLAPLARFLAVGVPIGYLGNSFREKIRGTGGEQFEGVEGDDPQSQTTADVFKALESVGAFGLGGSINYPISQAGKERFGQAVIGTTLGPTAGGAVETLTNASKAIGGNPDALIRQGAKILPVGGERVSAKYAPYDSPLSDVQEGRVNEAPPEKKQEYYDFFTTAEGIHTKRDRTDKKVKEAIASKEFNKAKRIADEYNEEVLSTFQPFVDEYGLHDKNIQKELKSFLYPVDTPSMTKKYKAMMREELDKAKGRW